MNFSCVFCSILIILCLVSVIAILKFVQVEFSILAEDTVTTEAKDTPKASLLLDRENKNAVLVGNNSLSTTDVPDAIDDSLQNQTVIALDGQLPFTEANGERVVRLNSTIDMEGLAFDFFGGKLCEKVLGYDPSQGLTDNKSPPRTVVNIAFSCSDLFATSALGSGNYISAFYGMRLVAATLGNVDVAITCSDANEQKQNLILPWVMGWFPLTDQPLPADNRTNPTVKEACADYKSIPIGHRLQDMRYEMRRMAIAMVGIPYQGHPAHDWAEEHLWSDAARQQSVGTLNSKNVFQLQAPSRDTPPLFPETELDDAILHFRCGDLMLSNHPSFGFMKFGSFSRHISPDVRSIGIVTQPFDPDAQHRKGENGNVKLQRCRKVVYAFVDHLREIFPDEDKVRIRIRNSREETIALTFARMVMANQTVIAISSFGVFPGVSTFGTGYIRKPDFKKAPNRWLLSPRLESMVDNVKLIEEPMLFATECKRMWEENETDVLDWFKYYTDEEKQKTLKQREEAKSLVESQDTGKANATTSSNTATL